MSTEVDPKVLAMQVALRLDGWAPERGCPAWIESADRVCGRPPAHDYLCKRHHTVALRRWDSAVTRNAERAQARAEYRARMLPEWKAELAKVTAEIERRDPPRPNDRAAYTGYVHPSLRRQQSRLLSDSNVQRMAELWRKHDELTRKIGADA